MTKRINSKQLGDKVVQLIDYLVTRHPPNAAAGQIVTASILLDTGGANISWLTDPMQFVAAGTRRRGVAPRYALRMFLQRIGGTKAERAELETEYRKRFTTEGK